MKNNQGFVKKRLAQYVAASLIAGVSTPALANDFTINNGQLTISNGTFSQTVNVESNGILESINNVPASNSFGIPNFSFDLVNSASSASNGTYTFKVGVAISSDTNANRRFEAYLGNLTLNVNGSTVTGTIPGGQDLIVIARDGAVNATAVVSNNSSANGPVTISGGSVTFSGTNLVNRLTSANAAFQTILNAFDAGGQYTFRVIIEQTSGSPTTRFGRVVNSQFTAFPRVQTTCSAAPSSQLGGDDGVFRLLGTVNNQSYEIENQFSLAYAVQGKFGVGQSASTGALSTFTETCVVDTGGSGGGGSSGGGSTGGGGTGGGTNQPVNPVNPEDITNLGNTVTQVTTTVDNEISTGNVSQSTVTTVTQTTSNANNQVTTVLNAFNNPGTTVNTDNALNALSTASNAVSTSGKAAANTNADTTQLVAQTKTLITGTTDVMRQLTLKAVQDATQSVLSSVQKTLVASTFKNVVSGSAQITTKLTNPDDLSDINRSLNNFSKDLIRLQTPVDNDTVTTLSNASRDILKKDFELKFGAIVTDQNIVQQFNSGNSQVYKSTLTLAGLPQTSFPTDSESRQNIQNFGGSGFQITDDTVRSIASLKSNSSDFTRTQRTLPSGQFVTASNDFIGFAQIFGTGSFNPGNLSRSGGISALSSSTQTPGVDFVEADNSATIKFATETYLATTLSVKSIPAGANDSVTFTDDGRALVIRSTGAAFELAPAAINTVSFVAGIEALNFPLTTRGDDGTFSLELAGGQRFSGTFGFENHFGINRTTCGQVTFAEPTVEVNRPEYAFVMNCANGASQRILPYVYEANFYSSLTAANLDVTTDRNTGFVTVTGVGTFKPSFFVNTSTAAEAAYRTANQDANGIAFQAMDVNADGKMDYKVISAAGTQVLYSAN
ncbi:MAG: hypothetical protein CMQ37_10155 [Gammaproteobacteria bacterium]|nr:hypothetical protein [Gammaproteobacteria bacterium]